MRSSNPPENFAISDPIAHPLLHLASAAVARVVPYDHVQARGERVAGLAELLAVELGWGGRRRELLVEVALHHDVGLALVAPEIVNKPERLSEAEFVEVRRHTVMGAHMLEGSLNIQQLGWVLHHHERWDGGGYPDRLAGDEIPEGARIVAVAEAWDAMTSERCYRRRLAPAAALAELWRCSGRQFDVAVVRALTRALSGRIRGVGSETRR